MRRLTLITILVFSLFLSGCLPKFLPSKPAEQSDPFAGWQAYTNKEYGFEIKYPTEWEIEIFERKDEYSSYDFQLTIKKKGDKDRIELKSENYLSFYYPDIKITVYATEETNIRALVNKNCEKAMQGIGACSQIIGETRIDGVMALEMVHCVEAANRVGLSVIKDGYYYGINTPYFCGVGASPEAPTLFSDFVKDQFDTLENQYKPIRDKILSTFKLTEVEAPDPLTGWRTFSNDIFSINYPKDANISVGEMGNTWQIVGPADAYSIYIRVLDNPNGLNAMSAAIEQSFNSDGEPKEIADGSTYYYTTFGGDSTSHHYLISNNEDKLIYFNYGIYSQGNNPANWQPGRQQEVIDSIIGTFQLTNEESNNLNSTKKGGEDMFAILQAPVAVDLAEMANVNVPIDTTSAEGAINTLYAYGAAIMVAFGVIGLLMLVVTILSFINIYHWGTTDNAAFQRAGQTKKKWYINFIIIPLIAVVVNIIPLLGQIASVILYIYWVVMVLIYFFSVRKKLNGGTPVTPPANKPV